MKGDIWWAFSPYYEEDTPYLHALGILESFAKVAQTRIQPVTFIDPARAAGLLDTSAIFDQSNLSSFDLVERFTQRRLAELTSTRRDLFRPPRFIRGTNRLFHTSTRSESAAIDQEARSGNALCVAVHARFGATEWFTGSFAETFLLSSTVPTLLITPRSKRLLSRHVVFATDMSSSSIRVYRRLLPVLGRLTVDLSIVHYAVAPSLEGPHFAEWWPKSYLATMKASLAATKEKGEQLAARAKRKDIDARFELLRDQGTHDASAAVVEWASKKQAALIALASQSGPIEGRLLGSTARKIAKDAPCPVLVLR